MDDNNNNEYLNKKTERYSKKKKKQEKNIENQNKILQESKKIEEISEGKVTIRLCNKDKTFSAFYNPAQELNRDLTVISIATYFSFTKFKKKKELKTFNEYKFNIIEPLSATGLRCIRYYAELPKEKINLIYSNDMDSKAVECININIEKNNVDKNKFKVFKSDAAQLMYENPHFFDVIDLDPYGTAIPFIDSCIHSAKNGALLCITFTDMPVLCGNYPETTLYKYGSIPYKVPFCHEMAIRIALFSISSSASKYKKVIKPLFSFNAEFYIRLFLIIIDSPEECKMNPFKYGYMFHCRTCQNRSISPMAKKQENKFKNGKPNSYVKFNNLIYHSEKCDCCGSNMCMSGPFWIDEIFDEDWINELIKNLEKKDFEYLKFNDRIKNLCNGILNELPLNDQIFNLDYSQFFRDINLSSFKMAIFQGALENLGYKIAQSYYDPNLFKTNAPVDVIYDILKQYKEENYKDDYYKNIDKNSYKYKILSQKINIKTKFIESNTKKNKNKYPLNPPNWGPKGRAKEIKMDFEIDNEKNNNEDGNNNKDGKDIINDDKNKKDDN